VGCVPWYRQGKTPEFQRYSNFIGIESLPMTRFEIVQLTAGGATVYGAVIMSHAAMEFQPAKSNVQALLLNTSWEAVCRSSSIQRHQKPHWTIKNTHF